MEELDELLFGNEEDSEETSANIATSGYWKILIVDDEAEVHQITKLTLNGFQFENKPLKFIHAYSAAEAIPILKNHTDIALLLLDVVMETEYAGLELVQNIRQQLNNQSIRIILRTGQPGAAPEDDVIRNYDINDYAEKSELTAKKLSTLVVAGLRSYRDIIYLEQSRAELLSSNQQLDKERQRIQVTLDSIGDAVLTTDAQGLVTHLNPVAEQLTGWKISEARGKALSEVFNIIHASSRDTVANPVEQVLQEGNIVGLENHTILISRDSTEYQIADSAAPIRDKSGNILGVILVCRDVTREYQTEEALRRSQKMEAIGQLTGGIAHDFNNQLGVVIGYLDFLSNQASNNKKSSKWIDLASKATLRCIDLTRQLLSFSRCQERHINVLDINTLLYGMKTIIRRSVTPEVDVQYYLSEDNWLTEVDSGDFQDAILNLVINARDAMPQGGQLIIESSNILLDEAYVKLNPEVNPGEYVQVMFNDTGSGMNKTTLERVFEPFYTTKEEGKGTGLGMAMVYGFVKQHEGHIKIYSEADIGTTIRLYLPRSMKQLSIESGSLEAEIPTGSETILIVDDEINLLDLAEQYLQELGYRTFRAENAEQALLLLGKEPSIQLLFTDVVMTGGMNGYELAQKAMANYKHLKILLTSGFTSRSIAQNGLAQFSANLLSKPYRKSVLAQRIRKTLDSEKL